MKTQGHITNRMLPLLNQSAFVPAGFEGHGFDRPQATRTMSGPHHVKSQRTVASLGDEDGWMQPGKGGA